MFVNIVLYAAVVFGTPALFGAVIWLIRAVQRHQARKRAPQPTHPPIEQLSKNLRRVHRYLVELPDDAPAIRRKAAEEAYDALLISACEALEVEQQLEKTSRLDRDLERLRIEEALQQAGLRIR
ncbi:MULTISPECIES: hypothetical protein [Thermocrispum]|jgi:predicted nucleic acid-binding protein|uniref:Uncharacterized protein n=1 Tax=Thermocrispum agreste TaxID=37925 RepID=A0A2W4JK79_9PSEU|nr:MULTISPECIES: hypothetical protein [Thermocrispum]PZM99524.1 MAG: hypothetical protein DIU77_05625 [Thermocrispum agreste]